MVYIFSSSFNPVVCKTIDWLNFYNVKYKRINNYFEEFKNLHYLNDFNEKEDNLNNDFYFFNKVTNANNTELNSEIHSQLVYEYLFGFFSTIENKNKLGNLVHLNSLSKIRVLLDAKKIKIPIPNSIVTNKKSDLVTFFKHNKSVITKPCHELLKINIDNINYRSYTAELTIEEIENLPETFGISLFQQNIIKKCDIKSVYFNGKFYSQAIFSQKNENTKLDFRHYDFSKMPRLNTFKIPNELENKIESLLIKYSLNFAVVDLILDLDDNLYFLEINVDGVFESISIDCNYYIEKKIAEYIYEQQEKRN